MTGDEFWRSTPRKLSVLANVRAVANGVNDSEDAKEKKKKESLNWLKSMAKKI